MIQRIANKPVIYCRAQDMAEIANEFAKNSKSYALGLMKEGFRADISAKDVVKATREIPAFNRKGIMTKAGRERFMQTLQTIFNVTPKEAKKVTIGEFVARSLASLGKAD